MPVLERGSGHNPAADVVVGLINNMPPGARRATELQFAGLLTAASEVLKAGIRFLAIEKPPGDDNEFLRVLHEARADALIVTGAEPHGGAMTDEPFWPTLAKLVDWAQDNTISTIWSCLAAHAAVFRLDQISRTLLPRKLSGVFLCTKAAEHALTADAPTRWLVPHSRYNNLDEAALASKRYTILSHVPGAGADSFVKQSGSSLFLMLQGHPEYGPGNLLGEYRRDVRRFLAGQSAAYPGIPEGYFDPAAEVALRKLQEQACRAPTPDLLASLDAAVTVASADCWRPAARRLFVNWLSCVAARKAARDDAATPVLDDQWRAAS